MRKSHTAVLDRNARYSERTETEPYEVGWANEARFFFGVEDIRGDWFARTEISPDGQFWCSLGEPHLIAGPGVSSSTAESFGAWLRVVFEPASAEPSSIRVNVYLALKG